ncbi:MAG: hypothetical protein AB7D39_19390 [Pseudodesulfovibrio sp.]|uniref:hypothetical protein n=1 Tax=Pseudodesulfovibrio sp. TaxID=2035812 RepID=UPI003D11944B
MSHTLHRIKDRQPDADYVVLVMPARGINNDDVVGHYQKYIDIFKKYNPVNMGGMKIGLLLDNTPDELKANACDDAPMVHAVFRTKEDLTGVLGEIKDKDYGYSVVVSGLLDDVRGCAEKVGLKPHSYNFSLGVYGALDKLPPRPVLEICTMCGHAMVTPGLVQKLAADIRKGKTTVEKAADKLTRPCMCGIFNTAKAKAVLERIVESPEV